MTPFQDRRQMDVTARHRWRNTKIAFWALTLVTSFAVYLGWHANQTAIHKIQASRQVAVNVTCGINAAIIDAGRSIILSGTKKRPPASNERALRKLGFPPYKVRKTQAQQAAAAYAQFISHAVQQQVGARARGVVRRDGSIDCAALRRVTGVNH